MTIRTRLKLFSILSLAVMLIMGILIFRSYREFLSSEQRRLLSEDLQKLMVERVLLRDTFIFTGSAGAILKWQQKSGQLNDLLDKMDKELTGAEEQRLVHVMQAAYQTTFTEFSRIIAGRQTNLENDRERLKKQEEERTRLGIVLAKAYELYDNGLRMDRLLQKQTESLISRLLGLGIMGAVSLILLVWLNAHLLNRLIMDRIFALHRGAIRISEGDLDHRMDNSGGDELCDLAATFNEMASRLKHDIAESKRYDDELRRSERKISVMDRIGTIFLTVSDDEVFGEVLSVVLDVMESRLGIFGFIADNGDLVIPSMTRGVWELCRMPDKAIIFPPDTWGESLWGRAIREKTAFYANGAFQTPDGHIPIDSFLAVPILFGDNVIGLLSVGNKEGGYRDEDKELQMLIAGRISPVLNARQQRDRLERERTEAEEALRISNTYNRSLIEASLDPLVTIAPDGRISDVNVATEKVTGYSREELIGSDFAEYFNEPEKAQAGYRQVFREGAVRDYPLQIQHRDGHLTSVLYNASVFRDEHGELKGVFAAARDVTEQKTLESQLLQAQKMEAIGQLAGGIAHDFNNIITGIVGFSTLMEMSMDKDDPQREHLSHVLVAADRAADLTKSLLAFSRKQVINPQPIDLNQIINKTEKFLKRIIGEDIDLKKIIHQELLTVYADSGQIEQVLMNLAANARDAMPHGGIFSIETTSAEIGAGFIKDHGYGEPGEYALVSISDNGTGMDGNTRKRLFEPFFTTKEMGKGTGLGLSIVYGIIKQHNGYINVYSEPGSGTTFRIYLPLLKAGHVEHVAQKEEVLKGGPETILLADDDAMVLELAEKVLVQFGYTVITAVDGLDAVEKFNLNRDRIALVILDVIMPKMNGKEALAAILKERPDMKALFISGYTADIIHKRGMMDESLEFVEKPLRPMKLLRKVRDILDKPC